MRSSNTTIQSIAFAIVLAVSGTVFGQESKTSSQQQHKGDTTQTSTIGDGKEVKVEGVVINRNGDTITLRGSDGRLLKSRGITPKPQRRQNQEHRTISKHCIA